jgi:hypothetical protein
MRPFPGLFYLVLGLVFEGCAGYRLGPTNGLPAKAKSIQVNPFQNQTMEPRLIEPVVSALRKGVQQDGTYRLDTSNDGDVIVDGVITSFKRAELSYQPNDVLTVRDYTLYLIVRIRAHERATGKVLVDREVSGYTTIRVGADLASAERQAIPMLAEDLARKATSILVDGVW